MNRNIPWPGWLTPSVLRSQLRALSGRCLDPLAGILGRFHVSPNALTVLGSLGGIGAGVALGFGEFALGGGIVLGAGFFDLIDGVLARRLSRVTAFGAFLDSTFDRISENAIFLGLAVYFANRGETVEVALTFLALISASLVSYLRARAEGLGFRCEVGLLTRPERVVILAIGLLIGQAEIALWILVVLGFITVLQRFLHIWQQTRSPGG